MTMTTPVPPEKEQKDIVRAIKEQNKNSLLLENRLMASIDNLKEYRTALLSAAVTGKIDVREEAA